MFIEKIDGGEGENTNKTAKALKDTLKQINEMRLQEARKRSETAKARTAQIKARLQMILNNSSPSADVSGHLQKAIDRCDKILEAGHHEHIDAHEFETHLDNLHGHVAKAELAHKESEVSQNETEKKRSRRMRTRNITNQQRRRDYRDKVEHEEEHHHAER